MVLKEMAPIVAWISEPFRTVATSLIDLQVGILDDAVAALARAHDHGLAEPARAGAGDVSFKLDVPAEERLERHFAGAFDLHPVAVIAEGLGSKRFGGAGHTAFRIILDPIDGTRPLAYTLRPAFSLAGVAEDRGPATTLRDIFLSIQTELPPPKQAVASILVAERGRGVVEALWNHETRQLVAGPTPAQASRARSVRRGFGTLVHFFPGSHRAIGALADDLFEQVLGPAGPGEAQVFDDQWTSTGAQIWALATGRYRFVADLRGALPGLGSGLTCHPYDLCTYLAAVEAGAIVTTADGSALGYPLDTFTPCPWIGYANLAIERELAAPLHALIEGHVES